MPYPSGWNWIAIAEEFPPKLVTNLPASELAADMTPDATGIDVTAEGFLKTGSQPSGTTRVVKTYTIGANDYEWHYGRLWMLSGSDLIYGAPEYTAAYFKQGPGEINFKEDAEAFIKMLPIGGGAMVLFKSTGAYIIPNASSDAGSFEVSDFIQEAKISVVGDAVELDGLAYFINDDGMFSINPNGEVTEISLPIRGDLSSPLALTADYKSKYIILGTTYAYDVLNKRWFNYNGSTFLYTTPEIKGNEEEAMNVDRVSFGYELSSEVDAEITISYQIENRGWSNNEIVVIPYTRGQSA